MNLKRVRDYYEHSALSKPIQISGHLHIGETGDDGLKEKEGKIGLALNMLKSCL